MLKFTTHTLWILCIIAGILTLGFCISLCANFKIFGPLPVSWDKTGQIGDFFGGIIGTLVAGIGSVLIYMTFDAQMDAQRNQKTQFDQSLAAQQNEFLKSQIETRFFELVRLHRENLEGIIYPESTARTKGRTAIKEIVEQFEACFKEISLFFDGSSLEQIYQAEYLSECLALKINRKGLDLALLAKLDIAYSITFHGVSAKDSMSLSKLLKKYYKETFTSPIVKYVSLKKEGMTGLSNWRTIISKSSSKELVIDTIEKIEQFGARYNNSSEWEFTDIVRQMMGSMETKFYGGHQFKLGQYFRHLFQTVKYINTQKVLTYEEKYDYIKTLRGQLSTIEQYILFYNSLSFMGREWELKHVDDSNGSNDLCLFTKYNFIKNLAALEVLDKVDVRHFYPYIQFEFEDEVASRKSIEDQYRLTNTPPVPQTDKVA